MAIFAAGDALREGEGSLMISIVAIPEIHALIAAGFPVAIGAVFC